MTVTRLSDYKPFTHDIGHVHLIVNLQKKCSITQLRMELASCSGESSPLLLNGDSNLALISITVDSVPLGKDAFTRMENGDLLLHSVPARCVVDVVAKSAHGIHAKSKEGILHSPKHPWFPTYTQCEREGFRKIAFFPDRPDVSAIFDVTMVGNAEHFPIMLSNGEKTHEAVLKNGLKMVRWHDPVPKPSYLFAMVAGHLSKMEGEFTTKSGKKVTIGMWKPAHIHHAKYHYAMRKLKAAMRWDEDENGLEYDLSTLNLVEIPGFCAGGMENKGLIIMGAPYMGTGYDKPNPESLSYIHSVLSHEFFHNWTGNRVTVTNWFETMLKESLTTYRDRQFYAYDKAHVLERIYSYKNVTWSVTDDDGKPLKPNRYKNPNDVGNSYFKYCKGAEIIRMLGLLAGEETFKEALSSFLKKHDQSHTGIEDFMSHVEEKTGRNFTQFKSWFTERKHPDVMVDGRWDEKAHTYTMTVSQSGTKSPRHFPMVMGLLSQDGKEFPLHLQGETGKGAAIFRTLEITKKKQIFVFEGISSKPTLSPFRSFSAMVNTSFMAGAGLDIEDLKILMAHDSDDFNRWRAAQTYIKISSQLQREEEVRLEKRKQERLQPRPSAPT
ncbi:MAG TPA: hypothetical protein DCW68_01285 [Rhodospirillaceae bacterium]|nr:MAG: hypothetical protein A2018_04250 [Alphaproteobacteria bacterium GWF2_58_20]HAU28732.1 hypothetical protein [Rhodospirillaceae bacterium]